MNQIDDSLAEQADLPLVPPKPLRKLSEPAHKTTTPAKPILKYSPSVGSTPLSNISNLRSEPSLQLARSGNIQPLNKDRIPLSFASRNEIPLCIGPSYTKRHNSRSALSSESANDLSKSPGWGTEATRGSTAKIESANEYDDYWGKWNHNKELPPTPFVNAPTSLGSPWPAPSSALPPTPPLTPAARHSFSQALPSQRYPLTPHNSIRTRRRSPPKATSELEHKSSTVPFPSRPSFTFSPPDLPSPADFPPPPSLAPRPFSRSHRLRSRAYSLSRLAEHANMSHPKLSQRPSLPSFSMREPRPPSPPVGSSFAKTRTASKRTAPKTSGTRKRRKVAFALPPGAPSIRGSHAGQLLTISPFRPCWSV
ncbi:hypothetical protein DFH11DRAFT_132363 [Phellopilus nigrolimitatus]|nr:hypothetical protein DFH11DRAFT_132363 [Phellopilus nigrolimitatus]